MELAQGILIAVFSMCREVLYMSMYCLYKCSQNGESLPTIDNTGQQNPQILKNDQVSQFRKVFMLTIFMEFLIMSLLLSNYPVQI